MENNLISVIVPVYNTESYLERCIKSILDQSYKEIELILVDDGSKDNSLHICRKWQEVDDRIVVVHQENHGVSSARNSGLDITRGSYIAFVDSDDWIEEKMFENLIQNIKKYKVDVAFSNIIYSKQNGENTEKIVPFSGTEVVSNNIVKRYLDGSIGFGSGVWNGVYTRECVMFENEIQYFPIDLSIGEDQIWLFECLMRCKRIAIDSKGYYHYFIREGSAMHNNNINLSEVQCKKRLINMINKYDKSLVKFVNNQLFLSAYDVAIKAYLNGSKDLFEEHFRILKSNKVVFLQSKHSLKFKLRHMVCYYFMRFRFPFKIISIENSINRG